MNPTDFSDLAERPRATEAEVIRELSRAIADGSDVDITLVRAEGGR